MKIFFRQVKLLLISLILWSWILNPVLDFGFSNIGFSNIWLENYHKIWVSEAYAESDVEKTAREAREKADADDKKNNPWGWDNSMLKAASDLFIEFLKVLIALAWFAISILWMLMDNLMVYNPLIVPLLKNIWQIFRNLVNVWFAVILVALVIHSAFFSWDWLTWLKKSLWKFVIALIFVNFSWTLVKIVVDAWTVLTEIVYRIPNEFQTNSKAITNWAYTIQSFQFPIDLKDNLEDTKEKVKKNTAFDYTRCTIDVWFENDLIEGAEVPKFMTDKSDYFNCTDAEEYFKDAWELFKSWWETSLREFVDGTDCECIESEDEEEGKIDGITPQNSMTVVFRAPISHLLKVRWFDWPSLSSAIVANYIPIEEFHRLSDGNTEWSTFFFEVIFSTIFVLMTSVIFIALATAMFIRLIYLWFMIMASPIAFLVLALEWFGLQFKFSDMVSRLVQVAVVVPAWVWLVFSIVFLFVWELYFNIETLDKIWQSSWFFHIILGYVWLWAMWIWTFKVLNSEEIVWSIAWKIQSWVQWAAKATWSNLMYMPLIPGAKQSDWWAGTWKMSIAWSPIWSFLNWKWFLWWHKEEFDKSQRLEKQFSKQYIDWNMKSKIDVAVSGDLGDTLKGKVWNFDNLDDVTKDKMKQIQKVLSDDSTEIGKHYRGLTGEAKAEFLQIVTERKLLKDSWSTHDINKIRESIGAYSLEIAGVDVLKDLPQHIKDIISGMDVTIKHEIWGNATEIKNKAWDKYEKILEKIKNQGLNENAIKKLFKELATKNKAYFNSFEVSTIKNNWTVDSQN